MKRKGIVTRRASRPSTASAGGLSFRLRLCLAWPLCLMCFATTAPLIAQGTPQVPVIRPKVPVDQPAAPTVSTATGADSSADDNPPPGDWAPSLLDAILTSSNPSAADALYDAAFAAGPNLIPQLQDALKDDRTAEFAAQCLAFLGGEKAMKILETLVGDPRDLDLRRFYLGALGEYRDPAVTELLLNAVTKSDAEPDRTVTEAAIWALTARSDSSLVAPLRQAEAKILDVVVRDEVDDAAQVIEGRVHYLASPEGRNAGASIDHAVRTYFIALLSQPAAERSPGTSPPPPPKVEVKRVTFSPDQMRVLAHVSLDSPEVTASYTMVLQKQLGDWNVVSVWVGSEVEKPQPAAVPKKTAPTPSKKSQPGAITRSPQ